MTTPQATAYIALRPTVNGFKEEAARQLRPQLAGVSNEVNALGRQTAGTTRELDRFSRGMLASSGAAGGLGRSIAFASTSFLTGAGIVAGIRAAIGITAQFQKQLNVLQAVTGASNEQLGQLSAKAKALGADLSLPATSAADAAEAMTELAKGGLSVSNTMSAAKGVLQLSAAAQIDNASAATITARALNAFGLAGTQAVHVADVLANAANVSTGEITDMALALQQSGAVAHQFGLSISETAAAISIMANAGIVGSDAGTSLKTFLQRIVPVSSQARKEMSALGVEFKDIHGNILPLPQILDNYKSALQNLSPAQRQAALQIIFGTDAIRAANILINQGGAGLLNMTGLLDRQGAAAKLAGAQMKGLSGAWQGFTSNIQTAAINLGEKVLPVLTSSVLAASHGVTALQGSEQLKQILIGIRATAVTVGPPLIEIAKDAAEVVHAIGVPELLAGVAVYKAIGIGGRLAAAGQALYARAVAASVAAQAKGAAASGALAASQSDAAVSARAAAVAKGSDAAATGALVAATEALVPAVTALTVALGAEATALTASEAAAARSVTIYGPLGAELAAVTIAARSAAVAQGELAAAEVATGAAGAAAASGGLAAFIGGIGRLGLAAVGGPFGAIALGAAAAAVGIVYLATRESAFERQTKEASQAVSGLNTQLSNTASAARRAADATAQIHTDKLAVQSARLAVEQAKQNLATTTAAKGSLDYQAAQLAVLQAQDQLRQSEEQLGQARRDSAKAQAAQVAQDNADIANNKRRVDAELALITAIRNRITMEVAQGAVKVSQRSQEAQLQAAVEKTSKAFDDQATKAGGVTTAAGRGALALEALTRATNELPTRRQITIAFTEAAAKKSLAQILVALGFTLKQAQQLATPSGVATGLAFGQGATSGLIQSGPLFVQAYANLIDAATKKTKPALDTAAAAQRKALEAAAAEQKALQTQLSVQDKVVKNREATLKTASKNLDDAKAALEDQVHSLGSARQALSDAQQQLADTIKQGQQRVADAVNQAKQNLSSIGSSLASAVNSFLEKTGGAQTSPALAKRFKELRDQIIAGGGGPGTAQAAQELASRIQAQQAAPAKTVDADKINQRFADAADLLNKGAIGVGQFNRRITALLAGAGVTAGKIQASQGVAAADQFRANLDALRRQAAAIATGPQAPGSGFAVSVVRPIDELKAVQRDIATAERAIQERQYDVQKETRDLSQKQLDETKATNAQLFALRREQKARAKQDALKTQLAKPKPSGSAAKDTAAVTGPKGGTLP